MCVCGWGIHTDVYMLGVYIYMLVWTKSTLFILALILLYFYFKPGNQLRYQEMGSVTTVLSVCGSIMVHFFKKLKAILILYFISSIFLFHIFYVPCPHIYCLYISQEWQVMIDPWISWNTVDSQRSRHASCILVSINCLNSQPKARFIFIMR